MGTGRHGKKQKIEKWPFQAILNTDCKRLQQFQLYKIKSSHKNIVNFSIIENFSWANEYFNSVTLVTKHHFKNTFFKILFELK